MVVVSVSCPMTGYFQFHISAFNLLHSRRPIVLSILISCTLQDMLDFGNGNHGSHANENQVEGEENTEGSDVDPYLHDRGYIETPAGWEVIPGQGRGNDHKAFKPHTDIDKNGHEERHGHISSNLLGPEQLWR